MQTQQLDQVTTGTPKTVAIIGLGPRGLSVLERLIAHARTAAALPHLKIHVIDPKEHGQGTHDSRQPDDLLINTVASQITMFMDDSVEMQGPVVEGPSLAQWARSSGYRRFGDHFVRARPDEGAPIDDNDYVPRRLLGEYLSAVCDRLIEDLPGGVEISFHRRLAEDIRPLPDGRHEVRIEGGHRLLCDFAFLTVGHGTNLPSQEDLAHLEFVSQHQSANPLLGYYDRCYPLEPLRKISPDATVLIQGVGLSANDVIAELTVRRGGRFEPTEGGLRYHASGREPALLLYSRQGLPFCARGVNQKGASGQYKARIFTDEAVRQLKAAKGKLSWANDIEPLLLAEMANAFRLARHEPVLGSVKDMPESDLAEVRRILAPDLRPHSDTIEAVNAFVRRYLVEDLEQARRGNVDSPVKAATDVLRDVRDTLRLAIDWAGLDAASQKQFDRGFVPLMNRVAVGPPVRRSEEMLALMEAGILRYASGPNPQLRADPGQGRFVLRTIGRDRTWEVAGDVLIKARLDHFSPLIDNSLLCLALLRNGTIKPFVNGDYHSGGIAVDTGLHPIGRSGAVTRSLFVLGNWAEGPNFYTYVLPRPGVNSRFLRDADRCVCDLLGQVSFNRERHIA